MFRCDTKPVSILSTLHTRQLIVSYSKNTFFSCTKLNNSVLWFCQMWYFTSGKFFPVLNSSTAKKKKIKKNLKLNLNCHASKEEKKKKPHTRPCRRERRCLCLLSQFSLVLWQDERTHCLTPQETGKGKR